MQPQTRPRRRFPLSVLATAVLVLSTASLVMGGLAPGTWSYFLGTSDSTMTVQIASLPPQGCTHSVDYWIAHPEAWPVEEVTIGGITYFKGTALTILRTQSRALARQLIAAKLNVFSGADPTAIAETIAEADDWLITYPLKREYGIELARKLSQYNDGVIGPGACAESLVVQGKARCPSSNEADVSSDPRPNRNPEDAPHPCRTTPSIQTTPQPTALSKIRPTKEPDPTQEPEPTQGTPAPGSTPLSLPFPTPSPVSPFIHSRILE